MGFCMVLHGTGLGSLVSKLLLLLHINQALNWGNPCIVATLLTIFSHQIVWENRKQGSVGNDCLVSVDGTDCSILWQKGHPESWSSHKFDMKTGLRCKLAI